MNMMMHMLASNNWGNGMGLLCASIGTCVLELHAFLFETCLDSLGVAVLVLAVLDRHDVVAMLFWKDFTVLHRLHRRMVMVLMYLTVDGGSSLFVSVPLNLLIHYSRGNFLMNSGVMMTSFLPTYDDRLVKEISRQQVTDAADNMKHTAHAILAYMPQEKEDFEAMNNEF